MKSQKGSCGYNRVFGPIGTLSADLEDILSNVFGEDRVAEFSPRTNVGETESGYTVAMELPGLSNDQINVEVQEGRLEISGEKIIDKDEDTKWSRFERASGKFKRVFEFSKPVDLDEISATFENGVLGILVPKSAKAIPRKVDIQIKS